MAWPKFLRSLFGASDDSKETSTPDPTPGARVSAGADVTDDDADVDDNSDDEIEPAIPRHFELEAELRAAPRDAARFLVYADWLQHHDDPRGEWILLQHALATETDPATREAMRTRSFALHSKHGAHLYGPLALKASAADLGFLRYARISTADEITAATFHHPALLLLETLVVENRDDVAEVHALALEGGRDDIEVIGQDSYVPRADSVDRVIAKCYVRHARGQRWFSMTSDDWFGMDGGSHSFLVRTTLESATGIVNTWSFGSDGGQTEASLADDCIRSESYPCAPEVTRVTCELRFAIENERTVVFHMRGSAPLVDGVFELELVRCPALTGVPFEPSPAIVREALQGPVLAAGSTLGGCAVPNVGAFRRADEMALLDGTLIHLDGFSPGGHLRTSAAGCDGTLVALFSPIRDKQHDKSIHTLISYTQIPAIAPIRRARTELVFEALVLSKHRAVLYSQTKLAVVDTQTGADLWSFPIKVELTARIHLSIVEHADNLHVWMGDSVRVLALATGVQIDEWPLVGLDVGGRQYGMGNCAFHPAPGRVAWMLGATKAVAGFGPCTIIGWRDRDGAGGEVAIEDVDWAREEDSFGKCAVLSDGRIIATGSTWVWLIDPANHSLVRIGPTGTYSHRLTIANDKLWSCGPGPAYLEIPPP